jgi:branched-chain amino acid transport system substrate-binding protein
METHVTFKCLALAAAAATLLNPAHAQISDNAVRIGVLTDLSGVYSDVSGKGTVVATQMAIDDFVAKERPGFKVEMVSADHQNKGDIAANKAREWFEREKVDVASELVTTSVALAVQKIAKEKNRIALISGRRIDPGDERRLQRRHGALDL